MEPTQTRLIEQIRAAFPQTPICFEGAQTGGFDDGAYRAHVHGKTWDELDRAYVLSRSDVLGFLGAQHLMAVLPVYLCSLVEDGTRTPAPGTLLLVLNQKGTRRFQDRVTATTPEQRAAVLAALDQFARTETSPLVETARAASERWKHPAL